MYITNLDEIIPLLRSKLREYLVAKLGIRANARKIKCFAHEDNEPSMHFNPKAKNETVKCFACGFSGDIFAAAAEIEGLPASGPQWITETVPSLCKTLEIPIKMGEPTGEDKERFKSYKLAQDIADILMANSPENIEYCKNRKWIQEGLDIGSCSEETILSKLAELGWDLNEVNRSLMVKTKFFSYFGEDKITFVIKDPRGRPIGFIARGMDGNQKSKYINTPETMIYEKSKALLGIDVAFNKAKKDGLYIVEGPGDLAQLYRLGIQNAVAVCGTAFTEHHLLMLKSLGIRKLYLNFDWDNAGYLATQRVLESVLKVTTGVSASVVMSPADSFEEITDYIKDPDDYLLNTSDPENYTNLLVKTGFEWQLSQASENDSPDSICQRMVPTIAAEPAAIKREILIKTLSEFTTISQQSISADVSALRNNKFGERRERLLGATEQYVHEVSEDPDNIIASMAKYENKVQNIEKEYQRNLIGVNYQIARYEAIQEQRAASELDSNMSTFQMDYYSQFGNAMSGGMNWTNGCLIYVGGRANSGKTATVLALGCDVALSDPNAMVIIHSTDDSYSQIEPRIKSNLYSIVNPSDITLSIGMLVQPHAYLPDDDSYREAYKQADDLFRDIINEERLCILDAEDGASLSVLEKNLRYYRQRYPSRKILLICDNTHNYMDFSHMDATSRMTQISNLQKSLVTKYHACMIATAEYRKNMPMDQSKMRLPVDDDLADARSLMYRPNVIFHVYNDLHDRKEHAEIFWKDQDGKINPRLLLHFTKNKISGYKEKIVLDLNTDTVALNQKCQKTALSEAENFIDAKTNGRVKINGSRMVEIEAVEYQDSELTL